MGVQGTPEDRYEASTVGSMAAEPPTRRCACSDCGAHVPGRVGLATVSGYCSVCGGAQVKPVEADRRPARFR
jgi:hypothetical protein